MDALELMPEYVLQPHAISRAVYRLSATARKIIAMGMAVIPPDLSNRTAVFSFHDFCQAVGYEKGGESQRIFMAALDECVGCVITIDTATEIRKFTWIQLATFQKQTGMVHLEFSMGLTEYLIELKKMYARIELRDLGRLQSLYAIRFYEMAKSYESLAGKNENRRNCWYFEREIDELRTILGIEAGKYKVTKDLRRYVIEKPCKEINEANLGIGITPECIKKGKCIVAIRFLCEKVPVKLQGSGKKSVKQLEIPEQHPQFAQELAVKEAEHLKKLYPDEYDALYTDTIAHPENQLYRDIPHLWAQRADTIVCQKLKEKHGIRL